LIVLDTNVISEVMKPANLRTRAVVDWLSRQRGDRLYTTSVSVAEILSGVAIMPEGKRTTEKRAAADRVLALFHGRVLSFEPGAAPFYAEAIARRRKSGLSYEKLDIMIAAIGRDNAMAVATRNGPDFEEVGVQVIDPWTA